MELESPFTVEFAEEVLVEIRQAALEAFRSLPYGGLEIGGVLFGRVSPSGLNPKRVEVAATRPMKCDHAAGPAFILSGTDRVRLTQLFEHARHEEDLAAPAVVGFWVSHGRSELGLTSHDADLYRSFFPHPWQVALILKPENRQPLREALFCRVNGRVMPYQRPAERVEAPGTPITPEPEFHVPEYREIEDHERVSALAFPEQPALAAEPFRIPSFQERVWQEQQEQALPAEAVVEEAPSQAVAFEPVILAPPAMKPPTAAELPRFATDIYLPAPPVEPPSNKTWAKDLYRPAGRVRPISAPAREDLDAAVEADVQTARHDDSEPVLDEVAAAPVVMDEASLVPDMTNAAAPAPPQAQVARAAEIGDELARLLVSIRAAATATKTKRQVVEGDVDSPVRERMAKQSFGLVTVVLLMIAGLLLGGVLGYWLFGNYQPVAAKSPGRDLGLEMFNTGREAPIHWDAKSPRFCRSA